MSYLNSLLPDPVNLRSLISSDNYSEELTLLINRSLLSPLNDFFVQPGKSIRPRLVEIGYLLAHPEEPEITMEIREKIQQVSAIVEMIHAGSMIVDDIQDGSKERRGRQSFHLKHGMPLALNAGNWLYFWALRSMKHLELTGLDDLVELMGKAHLGQALDLGTKIDEVPLNQIKSTCMASMELKTGTLLAIALSLGISLASHEFRREEILEFGLKMGVALQMFDDFENFQEISAKQYEDLLNHRPTWVWVIASESSPSDFEQFRKAVSMLPDDLALIKWSQEQEFSAKVENSISTEMRKLEEYWLQQWQATHPKAIGLLNDLKKILENSYVKTT